jgi:hypothetical protein
MAMLIGSILEDFVAGREILRSHWTLLPGQSSSCWRLSPEDQDEALVGCSILAKNAAECGAGKEDRLA